MSRPHDLVLNRKPSLFIGYLPDGSIEVVVCGTADEAWTAFKNERDNFDATGKSKYIEIAYLRKLSPSKRRELVKCEKKSVSLDWSEFDNDPEGRFAKRVELGLVPPAELKAHNDAKAEAESEPDPKPEAKAEKTASEVIQDEEKKESKPKKAKKKQ